MNSINKVYLTFHDPKYRESNTGDDIQFLYHYSSCDKAMKILSTNTIRFGNLNHLNDTTEPKPKIQISKELNPENVLHFCNSINKHINIACFSTDDSSVQLLSKEDELYALDFSGRGFALARMWAQYGSDNNGVCFIFNKEKILNLLGEENHWKGKVQYTSRNNCFLFNESIAEQYKINSNFDYDNTTLKIFLQNNIDFINFNYFSKLKDWQNEHEFRVVVFNESGDDFFLHNIVDCLEGVVVGERIDNTDRKIIEILLYELNKAENKKIVTISFESHYILLKT